MHCRIQITHSTTWAPRYGAASLRSLQPWLPRVSLSVLCTPPHSTPPHLKNTTFYFYQNLFTSVPRSTTQAHNFPTRGSCLCPSPSPEAGWTWGQAPSFPPSPPSAQPPSPALGRFRACVACDGPAVTAEQVGAMQRCTGPRSTGTGTWPHL